MERNEKRCYPVRVPNRLEHKMIALSTKTFGDLSMKQWTLLRQRSKQPVWKNELADLSAQILSEFSSRSFLLITGAYFDPEKLLLQLLNLYLKNRAFPLVKLNNTIRVKLSWDNRNIHNAKKNEAVSFSFPEVKLSQHFNNVHDIAVADIREVAETLRTMFGEIGVDEVISAYNDKIIGIRGANIKLIFYTSTDWMALIAELDSVAPPNTQLLDALICPFCGCTKYHLRTGWHSNPLT
jgi:hypothetical protein